MDYQQFSTKSAVEKPVENVENSCGNVEFYFPEIRLCQLIWIWAGFFREDICFLCEYSENYPLFVGNIENTPLLLGKLMVSSKGWRENQLSTALSSVVGESCMNSTPPAPTWLCGPNIFERWIFP